MIQQLKAKTIKLAAAGMGQAPFYEGVAKHLSADDTIAVFNSDRYIILPGFCDVHVHFREPGFSYKETIKSGSKAAAHGGYTAVCTMPNLNPVPDGVEHLKEQIKIIENDAVINVYPYASITIGQNGLELSDMEYNVLELFLSGKGYSDIAKALGITEKSVDNALARIRKKIKK